MWICTHCKIEIDYSIKDRSKKANHTKWCLKNPKRSLYIEQFKAIPNNWCRGLTKETSPSLMKLSNSLKEYAKNNSNSFKGKTHSLESREKISRGMMGNKNANFRGDRQFFYKDIRMDSPWEIATAKWLDENNYIWKYSNRSYKLSDGRHYFPDFFIYKNENDLDYLIEVKGYFREENKIKFALFKENYPDIEIKIWFEKDLKERNIL